jgi:Holliday junction DNA helicase RuvA
LIGKLKGIIDSVAEDFLILDVQGVGYQVFASSNTLRRIGNVGEAVSLQIITHVREDKIQLFGFENNAEKEWFTQLTNVNGVGNKMGIAVLSALSPDALAAAIASQDKAAFKPVAGVGPKLAERIITELKDKVNVIDISDFAKNLPANTGDKAPQAANQNISADAVSALSNLGYGRSEAFVVVNKIINEQPEIKLESLIREGLKNLSKR